MTRLLSSLLGFVVGAALVAAFSPAPATALPSLPAPSLRVYQLPQPREAEPTPGPVRPDPAQNPQTAVGVLGLPGQVECFNCAPFTALAKISHYDPMSGPINCWDYAQKEKYCYSPTFIGVHWKSVYGLGAACPVEWKIGTWVVVPDVGAFICLDRGSSILCDPETKICNLDILGPTGPWDGKTVTVTLWVPLDPPRED